MQALELKIPPPVVALITAALMWGIARVAPLIEFAPTVRLVAVVIISAVGGSIGIAGIIAFRCARTTTNPMKPHTTASLVCSGIYRLTRNPMYLGVLCMLIAWGVWLASIWALLGASVFVLYINRFQITPEERVLAAKFGNDFAAYKEKVRRWL